MRSSADSGRWAGGFVVLLVNAGCASSGANQLASSAASAVVQGLTSGPKQSPEPWSIARSHCDVFRAHRMACPALRTCDALLGTVESDVLVNVCVDPSGDLKPLRWCSNLGQGGNWCSSRGFPTCQDAASYRCDDFEILVCEEANMKQRIMKATVSYVDGTCTFVQATYYDQEPSDAGRSGEGDVAKPQPR